MFCKQINKPWAAYARVSYCVPLEVPLRFGLFQLDPLLQAAESTQIQQPSGNWWPWPSMGRYQVQICTRLGVSWNLSPVTTTPDLWAKSWWESGKLYNEPSSRPRRVSKHFTIKPNWKQQLFNLNLQHNQPSGYLIIIKLDWQCISYTLIESTKRKRDIWRLLCLSTPCESQAKLSGL